MKKSYRFYAAGDVVAERGADAKVKIIEDRFYLLVTTQPKRSIRSE